jgi:hypothetical protein
LEAGGFGEGGDFVDFRLIGAAGLDELIVRRPRGAGGDDLRLLGGAGLPAQEQSDGQLVCVRSWPKLLMIFGVRMNAAFNRDVIGRNSHFFLLIVLIGGTIRS